MCIISFNPYSHFIDIILFLKDFIYLFSERREGREKERERNIDVRETSICYLKLHLLWTQGTKEKTEVTFGGHGEHVTWPLILVLPNSAKPGSSLPKLVLFFYRL